LIARCDVFSEKMSTTFRPVADSGMQALDPATLIAISHCICNLPLHRRDSSPVLRRPSLEPCTIRKSDFRCRRPARPKAGDEAATIIASTVRDDRVSTFPNIFFLVQQGSWSPYHRAPTTLPRSPIGEARHLLTTAGLLLGLAWENRAGGFLLFEQHRGV